MSEADDMPCGACDMGIYSEMAMLNRKARRFGAMSEQEREQRMPRCKHHDRDCIGARHFHAALIEIDAAG